MEALMKEGGGGDHISVGMRIGRKIKPIPGKYLYMIPPGKNLVFAFAFNVKWKNSPTLTQHIY
jgi:hypothetical protein